MLLYHETVHWYSRKHLLAHATRILPTAAVPGQVLFGLKVVAEGTDVDKNRVRSYLPSCGCSLLNQERRSPS